MWLWCVVCGVACAPVHKLQNAETCWINHSQFTDSLCTFFILSHLKFLTRKTKRFGKNGSDVRHLRQMGLVSQFNFRENLHSLAKRRLHIISIWNDFHVLFGIGDPIGGAAWPTATRISSRRCAKVSFRMMEWESKVWMQTETNGRYWMSQRKMHESLSYYYGSSNEE